MPLWGIHLPDDAWAIRGGLNKIETLIKNVETGIERWSRPSISIWAAEAPEVIDLIEMSPVPHPTVCVTTIGRLRTAGFEDFTQTLDPPHHTIWLPWDWGPALERFRDAFDPPAPKGSFERTAGDPEWTYGEISWRSAL